MTYKPYDYQEQILEKLEVEREIYHRNRNLVIAATGVGKTVLAAFDSKNFLEKLDENDANAIKLNGEYQIGFHHSTVECLLQAILKMLLTSPKFILIKAQFDSYCV